MSADCDHHALPLTCACGDPAALVGFDGAAQKALFIHERPADHPVKPVHRVHDPIDYEEDQVVPCGLAS